MYLFDENGDKKNFDLDIDNILGAGVQGTVYKISSDKCLKLCIDSDIKLDASKVIRDLNLGCINKIYDFYFDKNGIFRAYTKKYYEKGDIDILTMPTRYMLDNFCTLYDSISKLSENGILASDLHTGNVIINRNNITVIDTDGFCKSICFGKSKIYQKNLNSLMYLFKELCYEAIKDYHPLMNADDCYSYASKIFNACLDDSANMVINNLMDYEYPIDYFKKRSR